MLTLTENKLIQIFIDCDDFIKKLERELPHRLVGIPSRKPDSALSASEILSVCICYHMARNDCFKSYYMETVLKRLKPYFPDLPSYTRFIALKEHYLFEISLFMVSRLCRASPEANFIDSKKLPSCHVKREKGHKVMSGLAAKGKSSTGWFFGMKLHLIINEHAKICRFMIRPGSTADNNADVLKTIFKGMEGTFFGDKGYLTKLKDELSAQGTELVTKVRKNMKKKSMTAKQKHYMKRRGIIETVFGLLAFQADIDHTRHRSQSGMLINLIAGLVAYTYFDAFPRLELFRYLPDIVL